MRCFVRSALLWQQLEAAGIPDIRGVWCHEAGGSRLLNISLLVNDSRSSSKNSAVQASVAGRNTQYGYPNFVCATIPPYS